MAPTKKTSSRPAAARKSNLNPPKKNTYWASIIIAIVGAIAYLVAQFGAIGGTWLSWVGFILVAAAFILLALSLTIKGL